MAKDSEEQLLDLPDFDEREFLKSERNRAKAVVYFFLIGAGLGLLSGYLFVAHMWYFALLLIFVFLVFLRFIMEALGLEMPKTGGQRVFLVMELVLTWLVFWILFLNPPLSVVSDVQVSNIQVNENGSWVALKETGNNVYPWYIGDKSYNVTVSYAHPFTVTYVNETLYSSTASGNVISKGPISVNLNTVTVNELKSYLYFSISSGFTPNSGQYLDIQITAVSNGVSHTSSFQLVLAAVTSGQFAPYSANLLAIPEAGVV